LIVKGKTGNLPFNRYASYGVIFHISMVPSKTHVAVPIEW